MTDLKIKTFNIFFLLAIFLLITSCWEDDDTVYTPYRLILNVHEFEIKNPNDIFDSNTDPQLYIRVKTEDKTKKSSVFNETKINFVLQGKTYDFDTIGFAADDIIRFSIGLFKGDGNSGLLDEDPEGKNGYIDGTILHLNLNDVLTVATVVIDSELIYLKFSYNIEPIVTQE